MEHSTDSRGAVVLDGRQGEGGGQIFRSALTLSLCTGKPVRIDHIRANRRKPGLMRQHLACARAAAGISQGTLRGDELGSTTLEFTPGPIVGGEFSFSVGSAGSSGLVLQTVYLPLLFADRPSKLRIEGGTHNAWAPSADFLLHSFLPQLELMGAEVSLRMDRAGFFPGGGGQISVEIQPLSSESSPYEMLSCGERKEVRAWTRSAYLDQHIPAREIAAIRRKFAPRDIPYEEFWHEESSGPGNTVQVAVVHDRVTQVFTGFASRGVPAKKVAHDVAVEAKRFLAAEVPIGEYLADQLLLPLALLAGGRFRTSKLSKHALTNIDVLHRFFPGIVRVQEESEAVDLVEVRLA